MSNPTTPFGWQMPTNTDLVTDLPADFEVFGQAVATSMQDLLGGTTGQLLSKTSNTDMDFTWTTPNPGDITGVTAGVGISGGGTSGDVTVTNSMATAITTNGDIIYGTGSGTFSILGIGSTNQVLKVTGGLPVWGAVPSGNLTETVFTSSNATYTIPTGVTGIWALCIGSGGGGGASSTATASNSGGGGGAGQAKEFFINIVGDTTLNITVPAGGAGGTAGGKGSSGSAATIVGNQSSTTYATVAGGGGAGGGAAANTSGINGASPGANGNTSSSTTAGGGGGMGSSGCNAAAGPLGSTQTTIGSQNSPTTMGVTGYYAGADGAPFGGQGINIWGRSVCGGGQGASGSGGISLNFGAGSATVVNTAASSATANTGAGGNGARTSTSTAYAGGAGGSGLVVLRYVV